MALIAGRVGDIDGPDARAALLSADPPDAGGWHRLAAAIDGCASLTDAAQQELLHALRRYALGGDAKPSGALSCATEHLLLSVARLYIDTRRPMYVELRSLAVLCPAGPMLWACEGSRWPAIERMPRGVKRALAASDYDGLAALVAKHVWCARAHAAACTHPGYCRCGAVDGLLFGSFVIRFAFANAPQAAPEAVLLPLVARWLALFERHCPPARFRRSMHCAAVFLTDRCALIRATPFPRALAGLFLHALEPAKALACLRHLASVPPANVSRFEDPLPDLQRLFGRWRGLRAAWITAAVSSRLPAVAAHEDLPRRAKQPRRVSSGGSIA